MATTYLQVTPVFGKWYVSERFPASKSKQPIFDPTQSPPQRSASEMILAGPFDTRVLATTWNTKQNAFGYIWEMERRTTKPSVK